LAEPLKNSFGPDIAARIGKMITRVYPDFDQQRFLQAALDGYDELELTPRARQIAAALGDTLPADRRRAIDILIDSLGPESGEAELTGMESFLYFPHVFFIARYGLDCFDISMRAQNELTRRFTAEFSIRAFIEQHPEKTMAQLRTWAGDPNVHVRRLVSEGSRPRLPWAPRLRRFQQDPAPVIELLELLKDDPEEYVRRSVANSLNDISKDHPEAVVHITRRWSKGAGQDRKRLIRHGLRTLIKQGHPEALAVLGYGVDSPAVVGHVSCAPSRVRIGDRIRIEARIDNPSTAEAGALVDFRVHFVKAKGSTSPRVFKGAELTIPAGESATVRKTVSVAQHSTRRHYPGIHTVDVMLNGNHHAGGRFEITGEAS